MSEPERQIDGAGGQSFDHRDLQRSAALSLRVRLLSIPHDIQARTISRLPQLSGAPAPAGSGQESTTAPARIAIAPKKIRRSTFSRKTSQAIAMVARPSVLSKRAPVEAGVSVRPDMSRAGPRKPPDSTMEPSQGRSPARSGASERPRPSQRPPVATSARPAPDPR